MAMIVVRVPVDPTWGAKDKLRLYVGNPGDADLAASGGGVVVDEQPAWAGGGARLGGFGAGPFGLSPFGYSPVGYGFGYGDFGYGPFGNNSPPRVALRYRLIAGDGEVCDQVPVGVTVIDEAGNESAVVETLAQLAETPKGVRDLAIAATANPNEAQLSWSASPDV